MIKWTWPDDVVDAAPDAARDAVADAVQDACAGTAAGAVADVPEAGPEAVPDSTAAPSAPTTSPRRAPVGPLGVAGRLLLVVVLLGTAGLGVWWTSRLARSPHLPATGIPALQVSPADVQPRAAAPAEPRVGPAPQAGPGRDAVGEWADRTAAVLGVPARALRAYGAADLAMRSAAPRCRVTWTTLAGIGLVESDHGRYGGARLGPDGRPSRPIVGVPLDGSGGVASVGDTDGGRLDGDPGVDRAVGSMQLIPSSWARWASDGDSDGAADPQDIDNAALTAARYLCADGRDVGTPVGWWAAILSYNDSVTYAQRVFGAADAYARRTHP